MSTIPRQVGSRLLDPLCMRSIGIATPITPVDATRISSGDDMQQIRCQAGHGQGILPSLFTGAGIGIAAVNHDGLGLAVFQMGAIYIYTGGPHLIGGKYTAGNRTVVAE